MSVSEHFKKLIYLFLKENSFSKEIHGCPIFNVKIDIIAKT